MPKARDSREIQCGSVAETSTRLVTRPGVLLPYILILLILVPQLIHAAGEDAGAKRYFQDFLADCGTNEIRCLWFHDDWATVGHVTLLNLLTYHVSDYRDVFEHAEIGGEDRKMRHPQVLSLQKIVGAMPKSDKTVEFRWSVFVAMRRNGKVEIFQYDRRRAPPVIQRIYDLGGGYFWDGKEG